MYKRNSFISNLLVLIVTLSPILIAGCGGSDYESTEDFLKDVRESNKTGEDGGGTMPPEGESFDQVAQIRLETQDLHVGTIANDKIHHHKLKVFNDGKMPLKITKIDTTCMCTMGNVTEENATVPGGGESWIDVTVDPNRVPGFHSHKMLTITSTDPVRPMVTVDVKADVDPEYSIDTDEVDFGSIPKGEIQERRLRFRQVQEAPVVVDSVEVLTLGITAPKIPGVSATVTEVPEAEWTAPGKREYDILIATGPDLPAGAFERNMVLVTDIKRFGGKQRITASGTIVAPYTVTPIYPERLVFSPDPVNGNFTATGVISATSPVTATVLETSNPILTAEIAPGASPNEVHVNLSVKVESMPRQLVDETVRVQVNVDGKSYTEILGVRNGNVAEAEDDHDH